MICQSFAFLTSLSLIGIGKYATVVFVRAMIAALFMTNPGVGVVLLTIIATCFGGNFPGEVRLTH